MSNITTHQTRRSPALPTEAQPLPNSQQQRGLTLLMNLKVAEEALASPNDRQAMTLAAVDLRASLQPAETREIAGLIESLMVMYPQQGRTDGQAKVIRRNWAIDLADYPADAIHAACTEWRQSDTSWMPTPGQLIAKIKPIVRMRQALLDRADRLLSEPVAHPAKPRPVPSEPDPEIAAQMADIVAKLAAKREGA